MKLVKFEGTLYSSDVLTFEKAKTTKPSISVEEYEELTGNKVPKEVSKKAEDKKK